MALYFFIEVKEAAHKKGFQDVDAFVAALLEEAKVAVIPGSGFECLIIYAFLMQQIQTYSKKL